MSYMYTCDWATSKRRGLGGRRVRGEGERRGGSEDIVPSSVHQKGRERRNFQMQLLRRCFENKFQSNHLHDSRHQEIYSSVYELMALWSDTKSTSSSVPLICSLWPSYLLPCTQMHLLQIESWTHWQQNHGWGRNVGHCQEVCPVSALCQKGNKYLRDSYRFQRKSPSKTCHSVFHFSSASCFVAESERR